MDGNKRWAKKNNTSIYTAYKQGMKVVKKTIEVSMMLGLSYLTLFVFSIENWSRRKSVTNTIMNMFHNYIYQEYNRLFSKKIKVVFIGNHKNINSNIKRTMRYIERSNVSYRLTLVIAISYSGKDEILRTIVKIKECKSLELKECEILFNKMINPNTIPDPDLLIRTSGEKRISNFLLWQISYTELHFTNVLWPDFRKKDLILSINEFNGRRRRYGK